MIKANNQLRADDQAGSNCDLERRLTEIGSAILLTSEKRDKLEAVVKLIETAFNTLEVAKKFIPLHNYDNFSVRFEKCTIVGSVYKRTAIWSDYDLDTVCEFKLRKNEYDMMDLSILADACIKKLRKCVRKLVKPLKEKGVVLKLLSDIRCGKMVRLSWEQIKIEVDLLFAFQDLKPHQILDSKTPKLLYPSVSRLSATSIRNLGCHPAIGLLKLWQNIFLEKRFISDPHKNAQEQKAQRIRSFAWELLALWGERKGTGGNLGVLREVWKFLAELDMSNGAPPSVVDFRPRENGILSSSYWEENKSTQSWSKFSGTQLELTYVSGAGGSLSSKSHFLVIKDPMDGNNDLMAGFHQPELLRVEARRSLDILESDMLIVNKLKDLFGDIPQERFCERTLIDKISIHPNLIPSDYCLRLIQERHAVVISPPIRVDGSELLCFGIYSPTEEAKVKASVAVMNWVKKQQRRKMTKMCNVLVGSWKRDNVLCFAVSPYITRIKSDEGHPKVVSYYDQQIEIASSKPLDPNIKCKIQQGRHPIIGPGGRGNTTEMLLQAIQDTARNIACSPSRDDRLKLKVLLGKMRWRTDFQFDIGGFNFEELKNFRSGHGLRVSLNSHIEKTCIKKIKQVIRANHKELGAHYMMPKKDSFGVKFIDLTDPNDPVKEWKVDARYGHQPKIRTGIRREVRWWALSELHPPTSLDLRFNITSSKQLNKEKDITSDERDIVGSAKYSELTELVDVPVDKVGKKYVLWSYKRKERFICGKGTEEIKISIREVIGSEYEAFGVNISYQWLNQLLLEPLAKKDKILLALKFFHRWLKAFLSYIEK